MGSEDDKTGQRRIDRRELIKRAAAAGGAAWAAPAILASFPTPASAQVSNAALGGCFKYMFDWRWAPAFFACQVDDSPQKDAGSCVQNFGEDHFEIDGKAQKWPNPNCCEDKPPMGPGSNDPNRSNIFQWPEFPDIPPGCVKVISSQPCATSGKQVVVTFAIDEEVCPNCRITDGSLRYDPKGLVGTADYCNAGATFSDSTFATSKLALAVTITFGADTVPIWFKFYVACGLSVDHPQNDGYVPDTDCQFVDSDSKAIN